MKQKITSFLNTCKNDLLNLNEYLYSNPEESYNENLASDYIIKLLEKHNFTITKNLCNSKTSFMATKGSGHPKICYLCEYDAIKDQGHITGHNLLTTMSVAATLALGSILDSINGTVVLIGCSGEYLGGTKSLFSHQGIFDDIDIICEAHPDLLTSESGSSSAIIPLKINFSGNDGFSFLNRNSYTCLDATTLTFNIVNSINKGLPKGVEINQALSKGRYTPLLIPLESESIIYIIAENMQTAKIVDLKIKNIVQFVSDLMDIKYTISLYESPNEELITNRTLNRIFSHNLKENGIININEPHNINSGLSIGCISHKVPTIHPYIGISNDDNLLYGTKKFADTTVSEFAFNKAFKASLALAYTGLDIIEKGTILADIKSEFYKTTSEEY